jgi:hypothetical protein
LSPGPAQSSERDPETRPLLLRPSVWIAVFRQALPVLGVFLYGWPVVQASVLFLADLWLSLTLHDGLELTFGGRGARGRGRALAGNLAFMGLLYGLVIGVGIFGHLAIGFPKGEWHAFASWGWRLPSFLTALAAMLATHASDALRFRSHLETRTERETRADEAATRARWARFILVVLGTLFVPVPSAFGYGGHALVVVIAAANLAIELFPDAVSRKLGL